MILRWGGGRLLEPYYIDGYRFNRYPSTPGQVVADERVASGVSAGAELPPQGGGVSAAGVPPLPQGGLVILQAAGSCGRYRRRPGAPRDQQRGRTGGRCCGSGRGQRQSRGRYGPQSAAGIWRHARWRVRTAIRSLRRETAGAAGGGLSFRGVARAGWRWLRRGRCVQVLAMPGDGAFYRLAQVVPQMAAAGDLDRVRSSAGASVGVTACPVPADDLCAGTCCQPGGERVSRPLRQDVHRPAVPRTVRPGTCSASTAGI
jgi:hypothetical protein